MISGPTLAESVATAIRAGILGGNYLSGERLIELNLAKTMGVSQITVRDALRILEQEGWVVKTPRRGVHVRSFTVDAAEEVYALIRTFESLAMEWVIARYSRQMSTDLHTILDAARKHAQKDERREAIDKLYAFHDYLARCIDKPLTTHILELLSNQSRMLEAIRQARAPVNVQALNANIELHDGLLEAIEKGDLDTIRTLVHSLFEGYRQLTISVLNV